MFRHLKLQSSWPRWGYIMAVISLHFSCVGRSDIRNFGRAVPYPEDTTTIPEQEISIKDTLFRSREDFLAGRCVFPVGPPDARGYYNAQKFGRNTHLGDDWNGNGGGNTDLGDTVYAMASGYVSEAYDAGGGWGNVIRMIHLFPAADSLWVESLYAHLDTMLVSPGSYIQTGKPLGTIGTAHGLYAAHLHFEVRTQILMPLGGGYSPDTTGYTDPTRFVRRFRKR